MGQDGEHGARVGDDYARMVMLMPGWRISGREDHGAGAKNKGPGGNGKLGAKKEKMGSKWVKWA